MATTRWREDEEGAVLSVEESAAGEGEGDAAAGGESKGWAAPMGGEGSGAAGKTEGAARSVRLGVVRARVGGGARGAARGSTSSGGRRCVGSS